MLTTVPHPLLDRLSLGLVVLALAVPATYLQVTQPSWEDMQKLLGIPQSSQPLSPQPKTTPKAAPSAVAPVAPTAPAVPAPAPKAASAKAGKTAITNSFVNLRAGKGVSTPIIARLEAGTTVQLRDDADTTWQGVVYQGQSGYIYRSYIQY